MGLLSEDRKEATTRKNVVPFKAEEANLMEVAWAGVNVGPKVAMMTIVTMITMITMK